MTWECPLTFQSLGTENGVFKRNPMMSFLDCWMYPATDDIRLVKGSREPRRAKDMGVVYVDPKILLQVLCHLRVGKALGNIWNFIFSIAPRENPSCAT